MPSATEPAARLVTAEDRLVAGYAALAISIHVLEAGFPSPVPGIKPGLANVVVLIALLRHGWGVAAWVAGLRVIVGSLLIGSFLSPTFWLSASGALASVCALWTGHRWNRVVPDVPLGPVGLSVLSAMAHMAGQFMVAWTWFIPHPGLVTLLPVLLVAALLFGTVTGWVALELLKRLPPPPSLVQSPSAPDT